MAEPLATIIAGSGVLLAGLAYSVKAVWTLANNIKNGNGKGKKEDTDRVQNIAKCEEHGTRIGQAETNITNVFNTIKEICIQRNLDNERNYEEHNKIFAKFDDVLDKIWAFVGPKGDKGEKGERGERGFTTEKK